MSAFSTTQYLAGRPIVTCRAAPFTARLPTRHISLRVRAESEVEKAAKDTANKAGQAADEAKRTVQDTSNLSPEMKKRMRDEYVGFGGAPNAPLKNNYFLWIIIGIGSLAVLSYLAGAI